MVPVWGCGGPQRARAPWGPTGAGSRRQGQADIEALSPSGGRGCAGAPHARPPCLHPGWVRREPVGTCLTPCGLSGLGSWGAGPLPHSRHARESLTDVFGPDRHRPAELGDELLGVQADLDDVVQQREQRGQREGRDKQGDKAELDYCKEGRPVSSRPRPSAPRRDPTAGPHVPLAEQTGWAGSGWHPASDVPPAPI